MPFDTLRANGWVIALRHAQGERGFPFVVYPTAPFVVGLIFPFVVSLSNHLLRTMPFDRLRANGLSNARRLSAKTVSHSPVTSPVTCMVTFI